MPSLSLPRQLARAHLFTFGAPDHFTISPDAAIALSLRSRAGDGDPVRCLCALDAPAVAERLVADPAAPLGGHAERFTRPSSSGGTRQRIWRRHYRLHR